MKKHLLFAAALFNSVAVLAQFNCGDSLYDPRDGQKYATVLIGSDCWFKQNLNYGNFVISDSTGVIHSDQFDNGIPEKYAQENDTNNLSIYGGLYEWTELMNYATTGGGQGLCPNGWHVSTDAEWQNLIAVAGATMVTSSAGTGGNKLKKVGEGFGAGAGTDDAGFSALHGGDRDAFGIFYGKGFRAIYWTSTLATAGLAYHYTLWAENDTIERLQLGTSTTAFSCRCVQTPAPTGLDEGINKGSLVYPNPATGSLTVNISSADAGTGYFVFDILGKQLISGTLASGRNILDISSLKNGIYFIQIGEEEKQKFIVNKN